MNDVHGGELFREQRLASGPSVQLGGVMTVVLRVTQPLRSERSKPLLTRRVVFSAGYVSGDALAGGAPVSWPIVITAACQAHE